MVKNMNTTIKYPIETMVLNRNGFVLLRFYEGIKMFLPITWLRGIVIVNKRRKTSYCLVDERFVSKINIGDKAIFY